MNPERHCFLVKSKSAPTVEVEMPSQAAYVRFKRAAVARTVARQAAELHLAVDLDKAGQVIGIEVVGFRELRLDRLIAKARVQTPPGMELGKAVFRMTPCHA